MLIKHLTKCLSTVLFYSWKSKHRLRAYSTSTLNSCNIFVVSLKYIDVVTLSIEKDRLINEPQDKLSKNLTFDKTSKKRLSKYGLFMPLQECLFLI